MNRLAVTAIYAFLLFSPAVVVYYSFSPAVALELPPRSFTLSWYWNLMDQTRLLSGMVASFAIATFATAAALVLGVPAAYALSRGTLPMRDGLATFFLSPLSLPGLVLAVGILMALSATLPGIVGTLFPLMAVHLLVTLPWVIRTVSAGFSMVDPNLEEAARGLGASPLETFFLVTLPALGPAILASAIFAFIVSFGNFALSLFFTSGTVTTLPVAIFEYIDQYQDPTVAAASTLVIVGTTLLVILGSRLARRGRLS